MKRQESFTEASDRRDQEAIAVIAGMSKKQRTNIRCWRLAETRNMKAGDRESRAMSIAWNLEAEGFGPGGPSTRPEACYKPGQNIVQWWAPWFHGAQEPPAKYGGKNRPNLYYSEVVAYCGWGTRKYAGVDVEGHLYRVY